MHQPLVPLARLSLPARSISCLQLLAFSGVSVEQCALVQVRKFWVKVEKIVDYKRQSVVDGRKKEAMDKHLSFLLSQTQKYSSLLAQRLANNVASEPSASGSRDLQLLPAPPAQAKGSLLLAGDPRPVPPPPDADDSEMSQAPEAEAVDSDAEGEVVQQAWTGEQNAALEAADKDYAVRAGEEEQVDDEATLEEEEVCSL